MGIQDFPSLFLDSLIPLLMIGRWMGERGRKAIKSFPLIHVWGSAPPVDRESVLPRLLRVRGDGNRAGKWTPKIGMGVHFVTITMYSVLGSGRRPRCQ
jgi:hypothetical protein